MLTDKKEIFFWKVFPRLFIKKFLKQGGMLHRLRGMDAPAIGLIQMNHLILFGCRLSQRPFCKSYGPNKHHFYCIVFEYLYSAPQQPWANRVAFWFD